MTKRASTWTPSSCTQLYHMGKSPLTEARDRSSLIPSSAFRVTSATTVAELLVWFVRIRGVSTQ